MTDIVDNPKSNTSTRTRAAKIADAIAQDIHLGQIIPGEKLTEEVLATRFDVSRGPVRDAIRLLERDGLVKVRPHVGAIVPELTAHELADLYEVRAVLFSLAVDCFVRRSVEGELPDMLMREFVDLSQAVIDAEFWAARDFAKLTQTFSLFVQENCGNAKLRDELARLNRQSYLHYVEIAHQDQQHRARFLEIGKMLLGAVQMGDPALAADLARKLVTANGQAVVAEFSRAQDEGAV